MTSTNLFIITAGLIGAGKSTLAAQLSSQYNVPLYKEPVEENPYLSLFYRDMSRWGFAMQIFLLNERFRQHQEIVWRDMGAIQDRSIYEDSIFAEMLYKSGFMCELDYKCYLSTFRNMSKFLQRPDVILYLDVQPEIALERIKQRSRTAEVSISLEYLQALRDGYERWFNTMGRTLNIIKVDWNEYHPDKINEIIQQSQKQQTVDRWGRHI